MRVFGSFQYKSGVSAVLQRLLPEQEVILQPGMIVKIGALGFVVERYNMGVVSMRGLRYRMEDSY